MRAATLIVTLALLAAAPAALAEPDAPAAAETPAQAEVVPSEPAATEAVEAPAAAEQQAAEQPPAAQVCRSPERSESRLRSRRERICRTQAEWDAIDRAQQRGRSGGSN